MASSDFEAILDAMKQREETAKQNNGETRGENSMQDSEDDSDSDSDDRSKNNGSAPPRNRSTVKKE
eukprot:PDM61919.1 hypothetical protein PRIPAC_51361 [Pristionchus pacificus]